MQTAQSLNALHIVAFTHRNLSVNEIGELHIDDENQKSRLSQLKDTLQLDELMFLSTCNRVEFTFTTQQKVDVPFLNHFFGTLYPSLELEKVNRFSSAGAVFSGTNAVQHILTVASSIDSMIIGEREIITQVRNAYDNSRAMNLTGDLLRILIRHTIETAKKVYTETNIARKPVSVVSLAYHNLKSLNVPLDSRILIVGAGITNTNMSRFLKKHGFTNFHVFNRTFEKAEKLAKDIHGQAHRLSELSTFNNGFDIIITCTGSENHILTEEIYTSLLQGETDRKTVIDIAIPQDLSPSIIAKYNVTHISVEVLQKISNENLKSRATEVKHVEEILADSLAEFKYINQTRTVELAMREVPQKVKEIKQFAMTEVFKNELNEMDDNSREVLEKIVGYMEKKYMSVPMLMAKEILLKKQL